MGPDSLNYGKWRKISKSAVILTLVQQCPISILSELFSYTTMQSNFMVLDFISFRVIMQNTHELKGTHKHR